MDYAQEWPTLPFAPDPAVPPALREDVPIPHHRVWRLRGLLSPPECQRLVAAAEELGLTDVTPPGHSNARIPHFCRGAGSVCLSVYEWVIVYQQQGSEAEHIL